MKPAQGQWGPLPVQALLVLADAWQVGGDTGVPSGLEVRCARVAQASPRGRGACSSRNTALVHSGWSPPGGVLGGKDRADLPHMVLW